MKTRSLPIMLAVLLALGQTAGVAHGQSGNSARSDSTVLPVWNKASGNLEAVLLLEPAPAAAGGRWRAGRNVIDAGLGMPGSESLGLVCDRKTGLAGAIGNLVNHCMLASLDGDRSRGARQVSAGASVTRGGNRVGVSVGEGRDTLPAWLSPNGRNAQIDENTLTVYGQKNIGREATVSIGGTWARARLIPAGEVPDAVSSHLNDRWNTQSITVGADIGDFGASIIGRVVDSPIQDSKWEGLGLGLTWRTPWSGQLTVGAENVVTRGKNPFAPTSGDKEEGTVPYVRYQQDL